MRVIRILFRKLFCNSQRRVCSDFSCGIIEHIYQRIASINIAPNGFMRLIRITAVFAFLLKYPCIFKIELRRSFMLPVIRIGFCEFFQCRGVFRRIRELFVFLLHSRTAQQAGSVCKLICIHFIRALFKGFEAGSGKAPYAVRLRRIERSGSLAVVQPIGEGFVEKADEAAAEVEHRLQRAQKILQPGVRPALHLLQRFERESIGGGCDH